MLWVWSLCSWENGKTYFTFLPHWSRKLSHSSPLPPQAKDLWQHINVDLLACVRNQSCGKISAAIMHFSCTTYLKILKEIRQWNINWKNILYKSNITPLPFLHSDFQWPSGDYVFYGFTKPCTVSIIWSRTAQKCVLF